MSRQRTLLSLFLLASLAGIALLCLPLLLEEGVSPEPLAGESSSGGLEHSGGEPSRATPQPAEKPTGAPAETRIDATAAPTIAAAPTRPPRRVPRGLVRHALTGRPLAGLAFEASSAGPWQERGRKQVVLTDGEGRFELYGFPRTGTVTFGEASGGSSVFELEPRTFRLEASEELVLHAHPPALTLHLSASLPDGVAVTEPKFWVQSEPRASRTENPRRERLLGDLDENGTLIVSFPASHLANGFLLVGIDGPRLESPGDAPHETGQRFTRNGSDFVVLGTEWNEGSDHWDTWRFSPTGTGVVTSRGLGPRLSSVADPVQVGSWRGDRHHAFQLERGSGLRVIPVDAGERSATDVLVRVDGGDAETGSRSSDRWRTSVDHFTDLKPGPHEVLVIDAYAPETELARASVELTAGEVLELVVELPAEAGRRLAASGTVVSASGKLLTRVELRVEIAGRRTRTIKTDREGAFEVWTRTPPGRLTVRPVAHLWAGRFEPASIECELGATGLRFTREKVNVARFRLYFEDGRTGREIRGFRHVTLYLERGGSTRGGSRFVLINEPHGDPFLSAPYTPRENLRWIARVPGYRNELGHVPAPAQRGELVVITAPLTPGYEEELHVVAAGTGTAIAGATVTDDRGRKLGLTDAGGRVTLRADDWPEGLRVEAPGFQTASWRLDREGLTEHWDGVVGLRPR